MKKLSILCLIILVITTSLIISKSTRLTQIPNSSKFDCNTCHTNGGGSDRNPFGQAVENITGSSLIDFWDQTLAGLDSDGDGWTNGEELQDSLGEWVKGNQNPGDFNQVTNPGDPTSHPNITGIANIILPEKYVLHNNYPNPFNPVTNIKFEVPVESKISVNIYSLNGEKIKNLVEKVVPKGIYITKWDAKNSFGQKVSSGIYIYNLETVNRIYSKKLVLLK